MSILSREDKRGAVADAVLSVVTAALAVICFRTGHVFLGILDVLAAALYAGLIGLRRWTTASLARKAAGLGLDESEAGQ